MFKYLITMLLIATLVLVVFLSRQDNVVNKMNRLLEEYVKVAKLSGTVLVAKDGKILINKAYGMANYDKSIPNTLTTEFRIGSVTKQFTAMAIMRLQEKGLLDVDDPISKYLPNYPSGNKIKVKHLLTHRSGISDFTSLEYNKFKQKSLSLDNIIDLFKDKPLELEPGQKHSYSNSNYTLLAKIIEKVSGQTYETYLNEYIFKPIGMNRTGVDHNEVQPDRAIGYQNKDDKITEDDYTNMTVPKGAGDIYSTTHDLYLWDRALYTDQVISQKTIQKTLYSLTKDPKKDEYAYGWVLDDIFGKVCLWHGGNIEGFNSVIYRFIKDDVCIILLSNYMETYLFPTSSIGRNLAAVIFGKPYEFPKMPTAIPLDPKIYDAYVGKYEVEDFVIEITKEDNRIFTQATNDPKFEIYPESETKFFFKVFDIKISFVKNKDGKVEQLILHQGGRDIPGKRISD